MSVARTLIMAPSHIGRLTHCRHPLKSHLPPFDKALFALASDMRESQCEAVSFPPFSKGGWGDFPTLAQAQPLEKSPSIPL